MKMVNNKTKAQVTIEFTFSMMITLLLIVGMIKVFAWTGRDLADRIRAHEKILTQDIGCTGSSCPLKQLKPTFYTATDIGAVVPANFFNFDMNGFEKVPK